MRDVICNKGHTIEGQHSRVDLGVGFTISRLSYCAGLLIYFLSFHFSIFFILNFIWNSSFQILIFLTQHNLTFWGTHHSTS